MNFAYGADQVKLVVISSLPAGWGHVRATKGLISTFSAVGVGAIRNSGGKIEPYLLIFWNSIQRSFKQPGKKGGKIGPDLLIFWNAPVVRFKPLDVI